MSANFQPSFIERHIRHMFILNRICSAVVIYDVHENNPKNVIHLCDVDEIIIHESQSVHPNVQKSYHFSRGRSIKKSPSRGKSIKIKHCSMENPWGFPAPQPPLDAAPLQGQVGDVLRAAPGAGAGCGRGRRPSEGGGRQRRTSGHPRYRGKGWGSSDITLW